MLQSCQCASVKYSCVALKQLKKWQDFLSLEDMSSSEKNDTEFGNLTKMYTAVNDLDAYIYLHVRQLKESHV